jgi:methanogen homoaconitase large subunit
MATLSERILGAPAGSCVDRRVDRAYVHDGTGVLTLETFRSIGRPLAAPERCPVLFDHIVPANTSTTADLQAELRRFACRHGMPFSDVGGGICHQLMGEGCVRPGELVIGADSHTCTLGAFGAFATGVGATDMAAIWATGETWLRVPETIRIDLTGRLAGAAEAKDLALAYVGRMGMDGATYSALEFVGEGASTLSMAGRMTCSNLAIEAGAKTGLFYADETTRCYLGDFGIETNVQTPDEATYRSTLSLDLGAIEPLVAVPDRVDTVRPVSDLAEIAVDQVFVGTCTNGRLEDIGRLTSFLKGGRVRVRTIVVPASRKTLIEATRSGMIETLIEAGCTIGPPGCGPCLGAHLGVIGEGEVCLSTANRNFRNRMGVGGDIYLGSVATAAATALAGHITSPEATS